ncbi:MAG: hypothetical protein DMG55_06425 [Acidobacteria bacterium]|nr:MAG: hypothetical protein DMG55_06425 [Acidobacteriota bacterium]
MTRSPARLPLFCMGTGCILVPVLGEQFGKPFVAQARKLDLSSSSAVESILERADGPRMLEPITGRRQF